MVFLFSIIAAASISVAAVGCRQQSTPSGNQFTSGRPEIAPVAIDLDGQTINPFVSNDPLVLLFLSIDCPISNRYTPEIKRLRNEFSPRNVRFILVYPNRDHTAAQIRKHQQDFGLTEFQVLRDPNHWLVKKAGVTVTPETAVFAVGETKVYYGRIDNRFVDFGKERAAATQHDLRDALTALLDGPNPSFSHPHQRAVGCYIPDP